MNTNINQENTNHQIIIRKENPEDYKKTEYMVMRAFWNLHGPGCNEHYLVHRLRESKDYLPELSRVAEIDGKIVGVIMYSRAFVRNDEKEYEIITFGPLCVEPTLHNSGVGKLLFEETMELAKKAGYIGICIYGEPEYYPKRGFLTADHFGITDPEGKNYDALMAYPLDANAFSLVHGKLFESEVFEECEDEKKVAEFTKQFPYHRPLKLECQWLHKERLGRISEVQKNTFIIKFFEQEIEGKLRGAFFKENKEFPVVGDYVTFQFNPKGQSMIESVCERTSLLKRPDQSGHAISYVKTMKEQVMVANFDYVFVVASLNDNYNFNRIARYVSITLQGGAIPVVILTKMDLCSNPDKYVKEVETLSSKVRVHTISALYGKGLEALSTYMKPGVTIAILGSSGVGKSTLVNAIAGKELMKTSEIRADDAKGRHTTTYRALIELENGVTIIDTPGMRELGMCDVEEGIDETFSDIVELTSRCRFRDCKHESEPGCAVKMALEDGTISKERFELYKGLKMESRSSARMKGKKPIYRA